MSSLLYAIGHWAIRARKLVLMLWIAVLVLLGAGAGFLGQGANGAITIPGTESQAALDTLGRTFEEVSGTSATIIIVPAEGEQADEDPYRSFITDATAELEDAEAVTGIITPFTEPANGLADDGSAALMTIQLEGSLDSVPDATLDLVAEITEMIQAELPAGAQASYGGEAFSAAIPTISPTEAIGVIIAFIVLILTLGSLIAAGMPLVIALLGVGVSIAGIFFVTTFVELTSTTPMLALMLGLAVGIDYTLFIVSRHQEQVKAGLEIEESIARATATSGSAVVFAGLTVIIALVGLSVAGIPFLTALGVAAAGAVAVAVLIAVTLTPAIMAMAGDKILPRKQRRALAATNGAAAANLAAANGGAAANTDALRDASVAAPNTDQLKSLQPTRADRFFGGWVALATKRPIITLVLGLLVLGLAAAPALQLRLALPNATSLSVEDPARVTYELTGEHFGEGTNGPLLLTGSIITSTDPLGLMEDLADEVRQVPGVADVPLSTPNPGADTGIIQVVPEDGPHAESTAVLVEELRDRHDQWLETYGVSLAVTGFTAVGIDVSEMLLEALIPFGILVVGLSLVLLAMVFRSVWVPVKATLGYMLSVGAAFGAVVAVFQLGWFSDLLNVSSTGPVLSFMPIILMGVLFGLAMDYEVFLVSRMREEVVHGSDAHTAIRRGFVGSAKVVTAAAVIMFAVFAAFVPEGDPSIKVIALGLAVGVFVDAFIVRMTLVPAVLELLGERAWRMPKWLDRVLPAFDVEGEGLAREIEFREWPADLPTARIASEDLLIGAEGHTAELPVPDIRVDAGEVLVLDPRDPATGGISAALAAVLSGRGTILGGSLKACGLLLPERASSLRRRASWARPETLRQALRDKPTLVVLDVRSAEQTVSIDGSSFADTHADTDEVRSALQARSVESSRGVAPEVTLVILGSYELAERIVQRGAKLRTPSRGAVRGAASGEAATGEVAAGHAAGHDDTAPAHAADDTETLQLEGDMR